MRHNKFKKLRKYFEELEVREFLLETFEKIKYHNNTNIKKYIN